MRKAIKLGKIKNGEWVKLPEQLVWNFDKTVALMLRDLLLKFTEESTEHLPSAIYEQCNKDIGAAVKKWNKLLGQMIDGVTNYTTPSLWLLPEEDQKVFSDYEKKLKKGAFPVNKDGSWDPDAIPPEVKTIYDKMSEIEQKQCADFKKALSLLSKYITEMWC